MNWTAVIAAASGVLLLAGLGLLVFRGLVAGFTAVHTDLTEHPNGVRA